MVVMIQHAFQFLLELAQLFLQISLLQELIFLFFEHCLQFLYFAFQLEIFLLQLKMPNVLLWSELLLLFVCIVVWQLTVADENSFDYLVH